MLLLLMLVARMLRLRVVRLLLRLLLRLLGDLAPPRRRPFDREEPREEPLEDPLDRGRRSRLRFRRIVGMCYESIAVQQRCAHNRPQVRN